MKKTIIALFALAGVASAALNETQLSTPTAITLGNSAASIDAAPIISSTSFEQAFTAVLTLDVEALSVFTTGKQTSGAKKTPLLSWTITNNTTGDVHRTINISVNNNSNNGPITTGGFYYKDALNASAALPDNTGAGASKFGTNGDAATSYLTNIDWDNAAGAALTIVYNGVTSSTAPLGTSIYFSVMMNDGTMSTYSAGTNNLCERSNEFDVTAIGYDPTYLTGLTIYDGYASVEQAEMLNKGVLPTITPAVPEPATATLSLLALAGLAARRRRK